MNNKIIKGLNDEQKEAVLFDKGICMVIASAGSGKTRVLISRIANLIDSGIEPSNILAVTFTHKAAEEMKQRLYDFIGESANDVNIGTFHSICFNMLKEMNRNKKINIIKDWQQVRILDDIFKYNKLRLNFDYKQCLNFISCQKNNLVSTNDNLLIDDEFNFMYDDLKTLYVEYEKSKQKQNLIDFDDMILKCYDMLNTNESIRKYYQNKYKYIIVDEFQDTNKSQYELIKLLLNDEHNLFVVGDDAQSIYEFRFADVGIMLNFKKDWKNCKEINLKTNYRSSQEIVDLSNKLINFNKHQFKKTCTSYNGKNKPVEFNCFEDEYKESEFIANTIEKYVSEKRNAYSDFAILYRCNAQSKSIENQLLDKGIPYIIQSGTNFLERKEILDITAYLKLIQNHNNNEAINRIINIPNRYLGKVFIDKINNYSNMNNISVFDSLVNAPFLNEKSYWMDNAFRLYQIINSFNASKKPKDIIDELIHKIDYVEYLMKLNGDEDISGRMEVIESFTALAEEYDTLDEFLKAIDKMIKDSKDNNSKSDKVQLMTVHKAKGLEFPIVFFVGVNTDIIPHKKSTNIEEERRIAYVAVSRAMKELFVSWTLSYNNKPSNASIFIDNMIGKQKRKKIESDMGKADS